MDVHTGWQRHIECLIFTGHFQQKSPTICSSFGKNELQLKASYESMPPCTARSSEYNLTRTTWVTHLYVCHELSTSFRYPAPQTRNGHRNGNENPRWSWQVSCQTAYLKREPNFDHRGFRLHFDEHFKSHLFKNGLICVYMYTNKYHWNTRHV